MMKYRNFTIQYKNIAYYQILRRMTAESYMIRNWMANIGNNNVVFQDWTGKYIIGERSERGERVKRRHRQLLQ
jgi:hypothetical protein